MWQEKEVQRLLYTISTVWDLAKRKWGQIWTQENLTSIRFNMPTEGTTTFQDDIYGDITVPNAELEDPILIKSDGYPTYNFANVMDDHLMGITHVVRGNEYLSSAPKIQ